MFCREDLRGSDELRRLVSRCDICVVDLDECIYPRFTQTALGALILARSLRPRYAALLPRLLAGAAYISAMRLLQLFGMRPANADLMRNFSRAMAGVPMALLEECASRLPLLGPQEWRRALSAVASVMPVYLLTFSIDPIAKAYAGACKGLGWEIFSGARGTAVEVREGVFRQCLFESDSFTPEAKARELSRILEETGCERPLVIGHGEAEAAMFRMAGDKDGGSIAIGRCGRNERLGASIHVASWPAISQALEGRERKECSMTNNQCSS